MNDCKKCKRLIEKALYDELKNEDAKFFTEHLNSCTECANEFEELKNTLNLFRTQPQPKPDAAFINNFWDLLEPKLKTKPSSVSAWWRGLINSFRFEVTWKYQFAGAAAILLIGIYIGRYFINEQNTSTQYSFPGNDKAAIEQTAVNIEAANYIERSKVLLLGLMNFDPTTDDVETISLPKQKEISRELLIQATELKADLKNPSQHQLNKLVSDIELILLQIANLETKYDLSGIELIQDGVKTRGIILKIKIQEMKESSKEFTPGKTQTRNENKKI